MNYEPGTPLYPMALWTENNPSIDPAERIGPEDIESYAYPPGERRRYTNAGWDKALKLGIAVRRYPEDLSNQSGAKS